MFKVFLVDNYDSFTFNLMDYFRRYDCKVITYRNDLDIMVIDCIKPNLIVLSPGPSTPSNAGKLLSVIDVYHGRIPIFGVCLGHQAIIEYFGGSLGILPYPCHGKQSYIYHDGKTIFEGIPNPFLAGRYHSLVGRTIPVCLEVTAKTDDDIVMGVRHRQFAVEGTQFHPESFLTSKSGHGLQIIKNVISWANTAG